MQTLIKRKAAVEVIQDRHWPETVAKDWRALQQCASEADIFQTWEWNATWWKHFGTGKKPYVVRVFSDDELIGLGAFYETGGAWKALRFVGTNHADYLGIIAKTGFEQEAARIIISHLMRHPSAHLLDLHQLPHTSAVLQIAQRMPHAWPKVQAVCSRLELPESWQGYLSSLSRNMRSSLKRYEQAAAKEHEFSMRLAGRSEIDRALKVLFKLHGRRWRQRGQPGAMFAPKVQQFHKDFARLAADEGWLRIHLLDLDHHSQAALYAFSFNNGYYFYQSGFDPRFSRFSPGSLVLAHAIRVAIEEKCSCFDFLRGQEAYKTRWKPQEQICNYRVLVPIRGLRGQAAFAWNRLGDKVEHAVRERFEGGLGAQTERV